MTTKDINAGSLASELIKLLVDQDAAYDNVLLVAHDHELARKVAQTYYERALDVARNYGFRTVSQALDFLESRTTPRWVYNVGLNALVIN